LYDGLIEMKIAALAGGVGGAKLADGLARALAPGELTVIVNTGDDFEHLGLKISPDLDTVCYTLAGLANPETGWGLADESWHALESLGALGGPTWFRLGDRDLGAHLERTRRLREGQTLSQVTRAFCEAWGLSTSILPMSDQPVSTTVLTDEGALPFQEYFVHRRCLPRVTGFRFEGVDNSRPAPGVQESLEKADFIVICPSNPWVSIDPILAMPGIRAALAGKCVLAVTPIVGGRTLKGPAAKMYLELGINPSAAAVAGHYGVTGLDGILAGFVLDTQDSSMAAQIEEMGIQALITDTVMLTSADRLRLAEEVLSFGTGLTKIKISKKGHMR
jgi:LPPG:FO 2-phospho-L-lactate transferase